MRIKKICVTGLFGMFDHEIPLNMDERVTIIHGPNGIGKTIILNMLYDLFTNNNINNKIWRIPFNTLEIYFEDDSIFKLTKKTSAQRVHDMTANQTYIQDWDNLASASNNISSVLNKEEETITIDDKINEVYQNYELSASFTNTSGDKDEFILIEKSNININPLLKKYIDIVNLKIYFIVTQRLKKEFQNPFPQLKIPHTLNTLSIIYHSKDLIMRIGSELAHSTKISQSLDSSFPIRLSNADNQSNFTQNELAEKLKELENKRSNLINAGILDNEKQENGNIKIDEKNLNVLSFYCRDTEAKLNVFDDIYNRISLFKKIVNSHLLHKELSISKIEGVVLKSDEGLSIPIDKLSSGEQHLIILFYELLFKVEPDTLILIDEPEISLHVGWQVKFLKDLLEVVDLVGFDVLIATHSPQIIKDRWDLTVQLKDKSS
jgi:predicted ATP-binding protein involved in virulence